jgi:hypothetical protein
MYPPELRRLAVPRIEVALICRRWLSMVARQKVTIDFAAATWPPIPSFADTWELRGFHCWW